MKHLHVSLKHGTRDYSHPSFEDFCKSMMGEWTKIDNEMEHLKNGYGRNDLKFNHSVAGRKRKERCNECQ